MAAESFFARWAKRKAESTEEAAKALPDQAVKTAAPQAPSDAEKPVVEKRTTPVTLEDVEKLTPDSDYSPFIARGVDENVKRSALKKLFADPHYNIMDGLDIYIDDYNKFEPIPPAMLAALNHAKSVLNPLEHLQKPSLTMQEQAPDPGTAQASAPEEVVAEEQPSSAATEEPEEETPIAEDDETSPPVAEAEFQPEPGTQSKIEIDSNSTKHS